MKLQLAPGTTREDVLDKIEESVVNYMKTKRGLDEDGMRKLLHEDKEVLASYLRKIERLVRGFIEDGIPPAFFGRKA
jgi:hypothetical protein